MECIFSWVVWSSAFFFLVTLILLLKGKESKNPRRKPPGPSGLPIVGNIFDLGTIPHQTLYNLIPNYGPILWLKLGSVNTLAIQSAKAATEFFKNHDHIFCDRKCPIAVTSHNYNQGSLAIGQYGAYWRILRRICSMELLINRRINDTTHIRRKCIDNMLQFIEEDVAAAQARGESGELNLVHYLFVMAFNIIGNLTLSRDLLNSHSTEGEEFFAAMSKVMEWAGAPNLADFFPFLQRLDPQGIKKGMDRDMGRAMHIIAGLVKERTVKDNKMTKEKRINDFLDAVLEYESVGKEGPDKISNQNVIIIILEMFFAGSETTSSTLEWAMTELLRNPESMRKIKEELDRIVGRNRKVEETDINELPYLKAVVKETLRLHPPIPLLLPRNSMQETEFSGYHIPKDTQIFVNAWAIGRDPECWVEPLCFKPERFLGSNIDYKGQNYELIPFGSGRRICVGMSLADRILHLTIASLIHTFEWELGGNITPQTLDMSERMGITVRKRIPLKVVLKKCVI
ncbi:iridoid oxidase-like [Mangifera indica]|uniref:iridoid oxidase-like n=1 Tax=Mangifera indica TaxID=29780 RepID=UPI001CF9625A|nr:iridoid oxidase-like [Mangifera indica]